MTLEFKHVIWARSEAQAAELQAQGWRVAGQAISHHSQWALLLEWPGPDDPPPIAKAAA